MAPELSSSTHSRNRWYAVIYEGHLLAGSKDRELGAEAAQDVGVDDRVEGSRPERLVPSGGHDVAGPIGDAVLDRAGPGPCEAVDGQVSADDLASGLPGQVEPGPSGACAEVRQPYSRCQSELPSEAVGLGVYPVEP